MKKSSKGRRTPSRSAKRRVSSTTRFKQRLNRLFKKVPIPEFRPRKVKPTWTTKTGDVIPVSKLTDSHLENIISFLLRQAPRRQMLHCISAMNYARHGAAMAAEREADAIQDLESEEYARLRYSAVFKEHDKRLARRRVPLTHAPSFGVEEVMDWYL